MQAREQRQGADYGNDDSDHGVAGVRVKMAAIHTDLLANSSVVHEAKVRRGAFTVAPFSANGGWLPANGGTARRDKIRIKPRKELAK